MICGFSVVLESAQKVPLQLRRKRTGVSAWDGSLTPERESAVSDIPGYVGVVHPRGKVMIKWLRRARVALQLGG